jgi:ABC-type multidrug transport system fused ATPase/permease subunit
MMTFHPYLVFPSVLIFGLYLVLHKFFMKPGSDIKRLSSVAQSPVFSHASSTVAGLATIRAYGVQKFLQKEFIRKQDTYVATYFHNIVAQRWYNSAANWIANVYTYFLLAIMIFFTPGYQHICIQIFRSLVIIFSSTFFN